MQCVPVMLLVIRARFVLPGSIIHRMVTSSVKTVRSFIWGANSAILELLVIQIVTYICLILLDPA